MKTLTKICVFIMFLLISLFNCVQAEDLFSCQADNSTEIFQYIVENNDCESYTAHAPKSFDDIIDTDFGTCASNISGQQYFFSETKHVNHNIRLIAFLFKTEIFPNAP